VIYIKVEGGEAVSMAQKGLDHDIGISEPEVLETQKERPSYIRDWLRANTFHHSQFSNIKRLVSLKKEQGLTISLCFPTMNEERTVGNEIRIIREELVDRHPLIDEIAVMDSGSTDRTKEVSEEAGADFYYSGDILTKYRFYRGKGENLWKSLYALKGDIICWIDADIQNMHPRFVLGLVGPLLEHKRLSYIKAFYKRPIRSRGELHHTGGGRVTELVVRPFFNLLFPELTGIAQPLSGEYAGRRELLERISFFTGYGVEAGHLIDILRLFGLGVIGQCDIVVRVHRNQTISALRSMSYRILKILLQRADDMGRIEIFQDLSDSLQVITGVKRLYSMEKMKVWGTERPPMISIPEYREMHSITVDTSEKKDRDALQPLPYTASLMFHKDLVIPRLKGKTKSEVVGELVRAGKERILDIQRAEKALLESGDVVETPIGKNIALFHAFGDFVDDIVPIIGLSLDGIDMKSLDSAPIHIAFMFLAPEYLGEIYKRIVESFAKVFSRMEHFEWLLRCKTPDEIIAFYSYLEAKNKIMKMLKIEDIQSVCL
jgi:glucosyl-3-phosphoglycerate synthase